MVHPVSLLCVFLVTLGVVTSHPNAKEVPKKEELAVVCADGEVLSEDKKCVAIVQNDNVQLDLESVAKEEKKKARKQHKKKKLQKKLDKEMKELKKMVLDGLKDDSVNIADLTCPEGQEMNEVGECAQPEIKEVVNGTEAVEKKKKSQKLQKKLERELELVLKKEIQNEMKRKRKNKNKKSKKTQEGVESETKAPVLTEGQKEESVVEVANEQIRLPSLPTA